MANKSEVELALNSVYWVNKKKNSWLGVQKPCTNAYAMSDGSR